MPSINLTLYLPDGGSVVPVGFNLSGDVLWSGIPGNPPAVVATAVLQYELGQTGSWVDQEIKEITSNLASYKWDWTFMNLPDPGVDSCPARVVARVTYHDPQQHGGDITIDALQLFTVEQT